MRRIARFMTVLMMVVGAWAQSRVTAPQVGAMIDTGGALRLVSGIAGSFVAGAPRASGVIALACAGTFCIAKTDGSLVTPHGIIDAPPGDAVLATDGKRSMAWFAQTGEFLQLGMGGRAPELQPQPWKADGQVLSMRRIPQGADIAVRRDSSVLIVTPEGAVMDVLPAEASGAVLLLDDAVAYAAGTEVVVRRADGSETRFTIPNAPQALFRMGANWVEIATSDGNYALRTSPGLDAPDASAVRLGPERLYLLPGGAPRPAEPRREGP